MTMTRIFVATLFAGATLLPDFSARAEEKPIISVEVGPAKVKKTLAAFPFTITDQASESKLRSIRDIAVTDLEFSGFFDFLNPAAFLEDASKAGITLVTFKLADWSSIGTELLIKSRGAVVGKNISLELNAFTVQGGRQVLAKQYKTTLEGARKLAHTIANDILFALTGRKGPFTSRLAFVSDHSGTKQIYISDYDGNNPIRITTAYAEAFAPAWSPDGKQLAFTAPTKNAKNIRNHNLFLFDLSSRKFTPLSKRLGLNSGAAFSPDGKQIALTMSFSGNSELYRLNPETNEIMRLTNGFGLKVDPTWSPDGKSIAFVSDSSGKSMVYKMDSSGGNIQRLTFVGDYNARPSWSPDGDKIVFAGSEAGKFDIYLMNNDGSNIEALTKNMGNSDDPDFAPGGYFIVYSSSRKGKRNLYITNIDNTAHRQITSDFGNCESPRWGLGN